MVSLLTSPSPTALAGDVLTQRETQRVSLRTTAAGGGMARVGGGAGGDNMWDTPWEESGWNQGGDA